MNVFYKKATGDIVNVNLAAEDDVFASAIPVGADSVLYIDNDDLTAQAMYANHADYTIQNGAIMHTPRSDADKLADAKAAKIAALHAQMEQAVAKFTSTALGATHTYLADPTSMSLLLGAYGRLTGPNPPTNYSVNWYTVEAGRVPHTAAQIIQLFEDGTSCIQQQYDHFASLETKVVSTTLDSQTLQQAMDQLDQITW